MAVSASLIHVDACETWCWNVCEFISLSASCFSTAGTGCCTWPWACRKSLEFNKIHFLQSKFAWVKLQEIAVEATLEALKLLEYCEKKLSRWSSFLKLLSSDAHRCDSNESWRRTKLCSLKFNYIQSRDSLFRRPDLWKCNYDNEKEEKVIVGMELSGSSKVLISSRFELPDNSC